MNMENINGGDWIAFVTGLICGWTLRIAYCRISALMAKK